MLLFMRKLCDRRAKVTKTKMKQSNYRLQFPGNRGVTALVALGLLLAATIFPFAVANAAQISTRSIQMSNSTAGATSTSYLLTFTPVAAAQELIVDFCGDTPFVGSTCAFSSSTVPTTTGVTASAGTATAVGSGSPVHTVKVTGLTMTAGSPFSVTLNGLTNPSTNTSFYARVLTFATGNAAGYAPATTSGGTTTTGTYVDYGGVALSTAANITITAKVMESLSFCVYVATCGDVPSITIGHGTNNTLDSTAIDTKTVNFSLSTNALHGAIVNMKGNVLSSGGNTIPAIGGGSGSAASTMTAGTAAFGMQVSTAGGMTASVPYNGTGSNYGLDTTTANNNITATYGDTVATSTGPVNSSVSTLTFGATASPTTPAGIYTTTEQLIATGTF